MIAKVLPRQGGSTRASARKLMAYLLGSGDPQHAPDGTRLGNRHTQPRVVAGWEPAREAAWSRQCQAVDWTNDDAAWAELHVLANQIGHDLCGCVGLEDTRQSRNRVWHTILAAHPDDGLLADEQWRAIATRLMHETGLHPEGTDDPVRWVAVRHGTNEAGADHIHVMAVLLRPNGRPASVHNDVFAAQRTARWAEERYGLIQGRGRTSPIAPSEGVRADRPSRRGDMTATAKTPPPYPRPAGMTEPTWQRVQMEGRDRMWTRQGRARAAVLSASARAISTEHLIALVEEQGYTVTLRHSVTNPEQVTGWSITAPADRTTRKPRSFSGRQLGADCTWPALTARVAGKGMSDRLRIVGNPEEDQTMIDRAKMVAAGWGVEFIERIIAADRTLIDAGPDADPALAYWMRDVFWQVSWALERSKGRHGVWTDAAYLYSAIAATGGVPAPPDEVTAALEALYAQYDIANGYLDQIRRLGQARDAEAEAMTAHSRAVDRWADSLDTQPHIPKYLTSPGGAQYVGTAAVAIALTTADIKRHTKALAQAAALHRAHTARRRELLAQARADSAYLDELEPWIDAAKDYEIQLLAALDEHEQAKALWREAAGRLLLEARRAGDPAAAERVAGIDDRYRRHGPPLPTR